MAKKKPLKVVQKSIPLVSFVDEICSMEEALIKKTRAAVSSIETRYNVRFYGKISFHFGGFRCRPLWRGAAESLGVEKCNLALERKVPRNTPSWCYDDESNADFVLYYPITPIDIIPVLVKLTVLDYEDCRFWPIGIENILMSMIISGVMAECENSYMARFYTARSALSDRFKKKGEKFSKTKAFALAKELGLDNQLMLDVLDYLYFSAEIAYNGSDCFVVVPSRTTRKLFYFI